MTNIKSIAIGLLSAVVVAAIAWLIFFGFSNPCESATQLMNSAMHEESPSVQKAAREALVDMSKLGCAAVAVRLKLGDKSFIKIVDSK